MLFSFIWEIVELFTLGVVLYEFFTFLGELPVPKDPDRPKGILYRKGERVLVFYLLPKLGPFGFAVLSSIPNLFDNCVKRKDLSNLDLLITFIIMFVASIFSNIFILRTEYKIWKMKKEGDL